MSNLAMKLDTLSYANRLIDAGCERKLAEAHASVQQETLVEISEEYLSQFATKKDLLATKEDIEHKIDMVKHELETKIDSVKHELETKIDSVKHELETKIDALNHKIDNVESKLERKIDAVGYKVEMLEKKIDNLSMKITLRLGGLMAAGIFILEAITKLHL